MLTDDMTQSTKNVRDKRAMRGDQAFNSSNQQMAL